MIKPIEVARQVSCIYCTRPCVGIIVACAIIYGERQTYARDGYLRKLEMEAMLAR